jgi:hypothetical protein
VKKETMFRVSVIGLLAAILVVQIISVSRKPATQKATHSSAVKPWELFQKKTNVFDQFDVAAPPPTKSDWAKTDAVPDWAKSESNSRLPDFATLKPFAPTAKTNGVRLVFDKIVTRSGVAYQNVEIQKIEPDAITINYTLTNGGFGACKIPLAELPISLQQRFGYDPQNALAYENLKAQMAADYRAYQAKLQNARLELNYEIAKQRYDDFMKAEQADALRRMADAQEQQAWEQQRAADAQERQAETLDWLDWDLRK